MHQSLDESLLGGILCNVDIATHAVDNVHHALCVSADQFAECVSVTTLRPADLLGFADFQNLSFSAFTLLT